MEKDQIRIGDGVMLVNPSVLGGCQRMVVKGLTAVEELVYCEGGYFGRGLHHVQNLAPYSEVRK